MERRSEGRFPFGQPSTERPPRRPSGDAALFVLGVYPSALHVAWQVPQWAVDALELPRRVAALAVDVEPTVFWDGADAAARVEAWKDAVGFVDGDADGQDGHVTASGNGTSGVQVVGEVLEPLGFEPTRVWFTDAITSYFVKTAPASGRPAQGNRIHGVYQPFASARGRPPAELPERPSPAALVDLALRYERHRLIDEIKESNSPVVVTLGEEARRVLLAMADDAGGPPTGGLEPSTHGVPGTARVDGRSLTWLAMTHPGNRSSSWSAARERFRRNPPSL